MAVETDAVGTQHAEGMPQLDFTTFPNQVFWLVVTLVVIYLILNEIAIPRIREILAERKRTREHDIELAETFRAKAVECEEQYERALKEARSKAREVLDSAKAEFAKDLESATAEADERIAVKLAESEERIRDIRANAIKSIENVAGEVAEDIVRVIMPGAHDQDAIQTAVSARMNSLSN